MRLPKTLHRRALAGLALATSLVAGTAHAQATKSAAAPAGPPRPIEEFLPAGYDRIYIHIAGTEANDEAWKKTAAFKILNETTTGKMLEAMISQAIDHYGAGKMKLNGAEVVEMIKHIFTKGAFIAGNGEGDALIVIRGVMGDKAAVGLFRRLILAVNREGSIEKSIVVDEHKIVEATVPAGAARRQTNFWWIEESSKKDLILTSNIRAASTLIKTLDGKSPNISGSKIYQSSRKLNERITPLITAAFDMKKVNTKAANPALLFQMGFDNDALLTVMRVSAPKPRSGVLALLDQAPLDKAGYPPLPEGSTGFTEMAVDLGQAYDAIMAELKTSAPDAAAKVDSFAATMAKSRIKLKEDLVANLGPRAYWFSMPKAASTTGLGSMMASLGGGLVPRGALVMEVKDPVKVGRALDELVLMANKQLKTMTPPAAPGGAAGDTGGRRGPGGSQGPGGEAEVSGGGGGGGSERAKPPAAPEFKAVNAGTAGKQYVLSMPPEMASQLGSQVKPTIRMSGKLLVIGLAPDVARLAIEAKKPWSPPGGSDVIGALPGKVLMLSVGDSSESTANALASLPGRVQAGVNLGVSLASGGAPAPGTVGPGAAQAPGAGGGSRPALEVGDGAGSVSGDARQAVAPGPGGRGGGRRDEAGPISGGGGAAPGGPGGPGGETPAAASGPAGPLTFQIAPELLPKAEELKSRLFPSSFALAVDDENVTVVFRSAFVDLGDTNPALVSAILMPAVQSARQAAGLPPLAAPPGGAGGAAPGAGGQPGAVAPGPNGQPGAVAPGGPQGRRGGRRADID